MELVYTGSDHVRRGILRDFALDMAFGDSENDFQLKMPLPEKKRVGVDRPAVIKDYESNGPITIDNANGSQLAGIEVHGKAERVVGKNLFSGFEVVGKIINATGGIQSSDYGGYSKAINVEPGDSYVLSGTNRYESTTNYTVRIHGYSGASTGDWLKQLVAVNVPPNTNTSQVFVVPDGVKFIRFNYTKNSTDIQLEQGSTATAYEPNHPPYVEVVQGRNLAEPVVGYFSDGGEWNATGTSVTLVAHVTKNTELVASLNGVALDSTFNRRRWYGVSQDPRTLGSSAATSFKQLSDSKATCNSGDYEWVTCQVGTGIADMVGANWQIERGSIATPYVPYGSLAFRTRGKNLLDSSWCTDRFHSSGTTTKRNSDGSVTVTGTSSIQTRFWNTEDKARAELEPGTYTLSEGLRVYFSGNTADYVSGTFTISEKKRVYNASFVLQTGTDINKTFYPQLELGTEATPYEPYQAAQTDIPLQGNVLASLPDGTMDEETVDGGGHVQLVKRVGVVDLGTLSYTKSASIDNSFFCSIPDAKTFKPWVVANAICSEYKVTRYDDLATYEPRISARTNDNAGYQIRDSRYSEVAEFASAMSGVMLYYELAEPQTIDLGFIDMPATYDGYTSITLESTMAAPFTVRYVEAPESNSYFVEVVPELEIGALAYKYGSEIGGIVDTKGFDNTGAIPFVTYSGRTWHGILDASITRPNGGQSHLVLTGDLNEAIATLINRASLADLFEPRGAAYGVTVSFQVPRYVSVWESLRLLCASYGMRPLIYRKGGKTVIDATPVSDYSNGVVSSVTMGLQFERFHRPVNHLVALGQGELESRVVVDVYADEHGNVSGTQTMFGFDEVAEVYELSNEGDAANIREKAEKRLKERQKFATVDIALPSSSDFGIGDTVTAINVETGLKATAEVTKKIVTVKDNGLEVTNYELGEFYVYTYS